MAVDEKLVERAENAPANVPFEDLCKLAEQLGWEERNKKGSHRIFIHPQAQAFRDAFPRPLNLQRLKNGKAKQEQVKEVLKRARHMGLIE